MFFAVMQREKNFLKVIKMKFKDHYSLSVERLQNISTNLKYPVNQTPDIPTAQELRQDFQESLNCLQAFGEYLAERNRTIELNKRIQMAKKMLDAWNEETEKQVQDRLHTAKLQFRYFIEDEKRKWEKEIQSSVLESQDRATAMTDKKRTIHWQHENVKKILEMYSKYLSNLDQKLASLKKNALADTQNIYFQRLEDDYEKKIRIIQKYLINWR